MLSGEKLAILRLAKNANCNTIEHGRIAEPCFGFNPDQVNGNSNDGDL
jgi:hypothetical protein